MQWLMLDTWIVLAGALSALACAVLGNFLVLRRMSMMGDAISHAVLPGLAIAFLMTGSRGSVVMFIGAAIAGVLTALFTEWVRTFGKVDEGASMGIVFTGLFALGLILMVRGADHVDIDANCVLYGNLELTPLDMVTVLGITAPRAVVILLAVLLINILVVAVFFKELRLAAFDPGLAHALGFHPTFMHYLLMVLVAMTTVASFESVGSILVIAMLIVPAAAAHLFTERLGTMMIASAVIAVASAVVGHIAAVMVPGWFGYPDTSTAGMMAVCCGGFFLLAMLLAPRHGLVTRIAHRTAMAVRIASEDMLGLLYRIEELGPETQKVPDGALVRRVLRAGPLVRRLALWRTRKAGRVTHHAGVYALTDAGREVARQVVRSHRLWETYLAQELNIPLDHLHAPAERLEHVTDAALRRRLAASTGTATDPQGKPIPEP